MTGSGQAFVVRDPSNSSGVLLCRRRSGGGSFRKPAIKAAFDANYADIKEITPGHALIIDKYGEYDQHQILKPLEKRSCSFERIYFSRASDPDIYHERKQLGKLLIPQILEEIDYDLENTVFSYIPNTAETAF